MDFENDIRGGISKRFLWVGLIVAIVLGGLAIPGYRLVREWRAESLADSALDMAKSEDQLVRAWEKANAAYFLAPDNLHVIRALAEIYSLADPVQALPHWKRAVEISGGAAEDRIELARVALDIKDLEQVRTQLDALEAAGVHSPEVARLRAGMLAGQMEYGAALEILEPWLENEQAEEALHSLYLQISIASQDPALRAKGLQHIIRLAERSDELGLKAIRLLIPLREKALELIDLLDERLEVHPGVTRQDRLLWLSWKLRQGREKPGAVYDAADELFDLEADEDLVTFAKWLNQNGYAAKVMDLVGLERARTRKDLFLIYMDALAIESEWVQIREILEAGSVPLESYLKQVFLARAYLETGLERRARLGWKKVQLEIANDPEKLQFFARYARLLGLYDEARDAYSRMEEIAISRRLAFESRIQMEREHGNTEALWKTLKRMHASYPEDVAVENDLYYTQLLLGREVEAATAGARALAKKNPRYLSHKITLALGLLRMNHDAEALQVFESIDIPIKQLSPSFRVILGCVLRANGQDGEADAVFRGVDPRNLLEEEVALFEQYSRAR